MKVSNDTTPGQIRESSVLLDDDKQIDITKIPGFYKKKHSHEIGNTIDFIHKLRKTGVLQKFFSRNDVKFAGIQDLFDQFYDKMNGYIKTDDNMSKD